MSEFKQAIVNSLVDLFTDQDDYDLDSGEVRFQGVGQDGGIGLALYPRDADGELLPMPSRTITISINEQVGP